LKTCSPFRNRNPVARPNLQTVALGPVVPGPGGLQSRAAAKSAAGRPGPRPAVRADPTAWQVLATCRQRHQIWPQRVLSPWHAPMDAARSRSPQDGLGIPDPQRLRALLRVDVPLPRVVAPALDSPLLSTLSNPRYAWATSNPATAPLSFTFPQTRAPTAPALKPSPKLQFQRLLARPAKTLCYGRRARASGLLSIAI
jgi:hypothetical protein